MSDWIEELQIHTINDGMQRFDRMRSCLDFWEWDAYHENKILDLKKVNRCRDRWCANCRRVGRAKAITEFAPVFKKMLHDGYTPYLMTLTVPNVEGSELKDTIKKMNQSFRIFWQWHYFKSKNYYRRRAFVFVGGVRCLEITKNHTTGDYHPHFHILLFLDGNEDPSLFKKNIPGEYSHNRKSVNYLSSADLYIRNMWYKSYNGIKVNSDCLEEYICDIRELDFSLGNPILEVFKYTMKDTDITDFETFKTVFFALHGVRLRQGLGVLYNLKLDNESDNENEVVNIKEFLKKNSDELPEEIITEYEYLIRSYHDYRKISRFNLKFTEDE